MHGLPPPSERCQGLSAEEVMDLCLRGSLSGRVVSQQREALDSAVSGCTVPVRKA